MFGTTTFDDSVDDGVDNLGSCLDGWSVRLQRGRQFGVTPRTEHLRIRASTFVVFGYSQSAVVASLVKNELDRRPAETDSTAPSSTLISNPMRPNGGILGTRVRRAAPFRSSASRSTGRRENSCAGAVCATRRWYFVTPTVDVAQQYDFLGGDAPARPLNGLAMTNSIMAYALLHGNVQNHQLDEAGMIDQGQYGDTHYYMIPANTVPLLQPLMMLGVPAAALALPERASEGVDQRRLYPRHEPR